MTKPRLQIVTTVPETLATILRGQPRFLSRHFLVTLVTSPGDEVQVIQEHEGAYVEHVDMARGIHLFKDMLSVCRMIFVLRKRRPEIIHSYTPKAGLVAMLAGWIFRVPIRIHTFTGLIFPSQSGFKKCLLVWIDRLICSCATDVVPEGEGVKKDLERFSVTKKPLQVIGYGNIAGVDTSEFSPASAEVLKEGAALRSRLQLTEKDFVYCYVGRLNRDKGIAELVKAFVRLAGRAQLLVVGGLDYSAPVDRETLEALENHPRIHRLGFLRDIRPALSCSDVLVLPSYREGFPNVLLQAGAMELPVVATDVNGSNEIVEPGLNGWLVPPRDEGELWQAMQAAMDMPTNRLREMGVRARARVNERFQREEHWQRLVEFYEERLERRDIVVRSEP